MQRVIATPAAVAAFAAVGAGLAIVHPTSGPRIQHTEVRLVDEQTLQEVIATAEINLHDLSVNAATASADLSKVVGTELSGFSTQISDSINDPDDGVLAGINNALYGGWYGDDDGYVFGLYGGDPVMGPMGDMTGSTLQQISADLSSNDFFGAFAHFDAFTLEATDHILFPLLAPYITEFNDDTNVTTLSIPDVLLQNFTNVYTSFVSYTDLKEVSDALFAPLISVEGGLSLDLTNIYAELSSGAYDTAYTNITNLPSDLLGDLLNGFTDPYVTDGTPFTGLLNSGSLLDDLFNVWPTQLADALSGTTTSTGAAAISDVASLF